MILPVVCFSGTFPTPAATALPQGLVMEETYSPGRGRPVGIVQQVLGEVVIMHGDVLKGYKAKRGIRLYKGDTVLLDTELEFQGLAFLEEPFVILKDFESSAARKDERPLKPMPLPQDEIEEKKRLFLGVAPEKEASADEDGTDQFTTYDDTGVDQVDALESVLPDDADDRRPYDDFEKPIRPWTPSEIDTIKESITEEKILRVPPDNPDNPTFPLPK